MAKFRFASGPAHFLIASHRQIIPVYVFVYLHVSIAIYAFVSLLFLVTLLHQLVNFPVLHDLSSIAMRYMYYRDFTSDVRGLTGTSVVKLIKVALIRRRLVVCYVLLSSDDE